MLRENNLDRLLELIWRNVRETRAQNHSVFNNDVIFGKITENYIAIKLYKR